MKKLVVLLVVGVCVALANTVFAISITYLSIQSQTNSGYEWNTDKTDAMSPIGVTGPSGVLLNAPDKSIDISLIAGDTIFLYTESFKNLAPTYSSNDLFSDELYKITIGTNAGTYTGKFEFLSTYGNFNIISQPDNFTLAFVGFTGDLVSKYGDPTYPKGLGPNKSPDAVYTLTYNNAVPEPSTLLLLGGGLVGLAGLGRKKFFTKGL